MTAPTPAINEVMRALDDIVSLSKPLPSPELAECMTILVQTVQASDNQLKDEIVQLGDFAVSVVEAFVQVMERFDRAFSGEISLDLLFKLIVSRIQWIGICKKFATALQRSGLVALQASSTANSFISLLPSIRADDMPMLIKKIMLSSFANSMENEQNQAQDMSQAFVEVKREVDTFVQDFEAMLNSYDLDAMEKRIKQLDVEIKDLYAALDQLKDKISDLTVALEIAKAAARATGILGFLCPVWWIGTAISAASAAVTKNLLNQAKAERDEVVRSLNSKIFERRGLQGNLQVIPILRSTLDKTKPDFQLLSTRIASYASIWAAIRADTQGIIEKLEYATDTDSKALFNKRVETAEAMYSALRSALNEYTRFIDASNDLRSALAKMGISI